MVFDELLPAAVEVDGAKVEHGLGSRHGPPHTGTLHPVFDQMTAGSLGDSAPDRIARGKVLVVPHLLPVVLVVRDRRVDAAKLFAGEPMPVAEATQAADEIGNYLGMIPGGTVTLRGERISNAAEGAACSQRTPLLPSVARIGCDQSAENVSGLVDLIEID